MDMTSNEKIFSSTLSICSYALSLCEGDTEHQNDIDCLRIKPFYAVYFYDLSTEKSLLTHRCRAWSPFPFCLEY